MKELSTAGIICHKKQAQPITLQQEEEMWQNGILGNDTPEKLVNTLLYLIGIYFALHAYDEHKNLKVGTYSQLKIKIDPHTNYCYLEYMENQSKNNQGGIKSLHHKTKVAKAFENLENLDRCIMRIFWKVHVKAPFPGSKMLLWLVLETTCQNSSHKSKCVVQLSGNWSPNAGESYG